MSRTRETATPARGIGAPEPGPGELGPGGPGPVEPECGEAPPEAGSARWWAQRAASAGRRRPRPGGLSSERIVEAALDVLREGGMDALTLRCVAERLDTTIASLYRHIASRDELIALIADHVMGDIRLDRTGRGWRADIEALMRDFRRIGIDQPLPSSARNRSGYGPNMLRVVDAALRLFLEAGLTEKKAGYATITMLELMASSAVLRVHRGQASGRAKGSDGFGELLDQLPADQFTALRTSGDFYVSAQADDIFEHSMALFLDGVTSQLSASRP
ncbi:TetR/AcrR family transcriptional regulator C-terminal domain-containing protein [Frankia sp. CNm7]|uniref:TetR/AcrR family transcriptional regulator C-terminal domain-containing protein n=1 Tax=Frankia nepalensis TaxID=1836974 RepID=A0A937RM87_9ACTN|nr:TetR/AcrR family transcriptional regulator [Frankia nepalensis]MBL7500160.1 TetR/AcrR family transcriptional regulator C-terminal domain-containing protein [Frankia nepalensis]MBL7512391.1 TetR/AcrR family transcriptional regulator C-terminal domain-containing protein [Frankia nepalensis]MBL7523924.1 TetR/AcrR family transcriptional regulator C-terminal domain-containing protein [Frankia nepalensis]MBL7632707.1 TetR/AcrR family transcriptional regulator C-terminal domain-containing protein [